MISQQQRHWVSRCAGVVSTWLSVLVFSTTLLGQSQTPNEEQPAVARNTLQASALPANWQGEAALGIVVTDDGGNPLADVDVLLRLEAEAAGGTLLLRTDSSGRAQARGLAPGEWQVDLRREGYMLLTAYLRLDISKDPKVGFTSRQRTGTFWEELEAVFVPVDLPITAAVKTGRDTPKQARKAQRQAIQQAKAEEKRRQRLQRRGSLARVVEEPDAAERAAAKEAARREEQERRRVEKAEREAREAAERAAAVAAREEERREQARRRGRLATVVDEQPSVSSEDSEDRTILASTAGEDPLGEVRAERSGEEEQSRDGQTTTLDFNEGAIVPREPGAEEGLDSRSDSVPAAEVPVISTAVEQPAPPPEAAPRLLRNPRLLPAGACPECRPGEYSVHTEVEVAAAVDGVAPCTRTMAADLPPLARTIDRGLNAEQQAFAGSAREEDGNDVLRLLGAAERQRVEPVLEGLQGENASCVALAIVLPRGAEYIGFRYQAGERGTLAECLLGQDCQIREARWVETPIVTATDSVTLVHAVFENRSTRRARQARFVVYFRPAPGWLPPN